MSPVTDLTTSGPVTNIRPSGASTTMSVSAGPYAPPPAVGPSTSESCGIRPLAVTIAWKTSPNAFKDATPSLNRAPPECHNPIIGDCAPIAARYA